MKIGDTIVSEGYRFEILTVTGRNFTATDQNSGRSRSGYVVSEHGGGTDIEWLDGNPNWHAESPGKPAAQHRGYTPPPEPDPAEASRADRFSRDPFDD